MIAKPTPDIGERIANQPKVNPTMTLLMRMRINSVSVTGQFALSNRTLISSDVKKESRELIRNRKRTRPERPQPLDRRSTSSGTSA